MPNVIDPNAGFISVTFGPFADGDADKDVTLDVYHALELASEVSERYMRELEAEGKQAEFSNHELLRRWAVLLLKPHGVDGNKLSHTARKELQSLVFRSLDAEKKDEPVSSTPA